MKVQVFLAVLASMACAAMALQCKSCMQFDIQSDEESIKPMIDMLKGMGNSNCKNNVDDSSIQSQPCPAAPQGKKAVCSSMSIATEYNIPEPKLSLNMKMYMRACQVVPSAEQLRCEGISQYEDLVRQSMGAQANMLGSMDGNVCICEGDNCNNNKISEDGVEPSADQESNADANKDTDADGKENAAAAPIVLISSLFLLLVHLL